MQQIKSYWRMGTLAAAAGLIIAFVDSACTVTTTSDEAGAGGTDVTAGANTAAGAVAVAGADTAGGAGGAAAGATNAAGTGGADKVPYDCTPASGDVLGTPNSCAPAAGAETDKCALCVQAKCCTEFSNCYATDPGNQCGWGGPNDQGEIVCIEQCIQDGFQKSQVYDDSLVTTCTGSCATNIANGSTKECGQFVGQQTNDLVACLGTNCQGPCFTGEAN